MGFFYEQENFKEPGGESGELNLTQGRAARGGDKSGVAH